MYSNGINFQYKFIGQKRVSIFKEGKIDANIYKSNLILVLALPPTSHPFVRPAAKAQLSAPSPFVGWCSLPFVVIACRSSCLGANVFWCRSWA